MMRARALLTIILLLPSFAPPAGAQPASAREHFERGIEAFRERRYPEAQQALKRAYELSPEAETLFAWAQAARLAGDCRTAVGLYRHFLEMRPTGMQADAARIPLARCEQQLGPPVATAPLPPAPPPVATAPAPAAPVVRDAGPTPRRWYQDPLGDGLAAGGLVGLGVGIGFLVAGGSAADDAAGADTYDEALAGRDRARSRRVVGGISLVAGFALIGAATFRWISVERAGHRVTAAPTGAGGGMVWWEGRF